MKMIARYLKPYVKRMALGMSIKLSGAFMELLLPLILAHIIDTLVPAGERGPIFLWGGLMIVAALLAWIFNITANRMASLVAARSVRNMRDDLFERTMHLSRRQVERYTVPSLESRMTTDTYNVHRFIGMIQRLGVRAPMLFFGGIIFCFVLAWRLALILLLLLPPIAIILVVVSKRSFPRFTALHARIDDMVRVVRENIQGIQVIKALDKTDYEKRRFAEANEAVRATEEDANLLMATTNPLITLILNSGLAAVLILGGWLVYRGPTKPGVIISFLSYFIQITNALMGLNRMFVMYNRASASSSRIDEVLRTPEAKEQKILPASACAVAGDASSDASTDADTEAGQEAARAGSVTRPPRAAAIREAAVAFDRVSFSYGGAPALKDISFTLKRGEALGIIGATGSGKSTLIHLLLRHYDTTEGTIYVNGRPLRTYPLSELREKFGVVFQDDFLYADTLRANIDFGRDFDDDTLLEAATYAQALEFIETKAGGLDFELASQGVNLSGGQQQRVLLSRAMAGHPEILILDDSSSALDFVTESKLRRALETGYTDTTRILIAQRISAVQHCEHILMLEAGEAIGYGTHDELMATVPLYREIAEQQMGVTA